MVKVDPTVQTLTSAGVVAIAISVLLNWTVAGHSNEAAKNESAPSASVTAKSDNNAMKALWAASATGRVEPKEGEVRITAQSAGEIMEVQAKTNQRVEAGDLLVRLDDEDLWSKRVAAVAEEAVRVRERDEEDVAGIARDRRAAEDRVAKAERDLFQARLDLDAKAAELRGGSGKPEELKSVRDKIETAKSKLASEKAALSKLEGTATMPLPTRLESSLTIARSDLAQVETAIERQRIRAPFAGTVLNVWAKVGEVAAPSGDLPLVLFGDLGSLRVRTEVEERDVVKVRVGQRVVVRGDAFPDKDFEGVVTSLAPALGPPRLLARGPRRPNDVEVLEVLVSLDGNPLLLTGMRVDVFFKLENEASSATSPKSTN